MHFPNATEIAFLAISAAGWTYVATKTSGPFGSIARLRKSWPTGPLQCPTCTGVWLGAIVCAGYLVAENAPALAAPLAVVAAAGVGAAAATVLALGLEWIKAGIDLNEQAAYRVAAENIIEDERRAEENARAQKE